MKKNKRGEKLRTILFSLFLGVVFFLITGFLIFSNWKIGQRREEFIKQIKQLEEEIRVLEEKNKELKADISHSLDADYIEEVARERLSLKKPGEEMVVVLPPPQPNQKLPEEKETSSFLQKLLKLLGF